MKALVLTLLTLIVAGCGSGGQSGPLSVQQALDGTSGEPHLVRGALIATGETIRLCSAILESYPPQCGGPFLVVEGLDLGSLEGLTTADGVTWSDRQVELRGTVAEGTLTIV
ncbi:MAG TPA: hypothetical protein VGJ34_07175 [Gaiellaceae bacterium]|jgi:hypothetical protein